MKMFGARAGVPGFAASLPTIAGAKVARAHRSAFARQRRIGGFAGSMPGAAPGSIT